MKNLSMQTAEMSVYPKLRLGLVDERCCKRKWLARGVGGLSTASRIWAPHYLKYQTSHESVSRGCEGV